MFLPRLTGILLHPTSLPSHGGIGDFGPAAYQFVDFLASGKQGLWQVLPLGPPAHGNSPYSSTSAFAGNPLLISLERLADHGWIKPASLDLPLAAAGPVDYAQVIRFKPPLLLAAAKRFLSSASPGAKARFDNFVSANEWWLEDFVLYDALRERYKPACWKQWPQALARREPTAVESAHSELASEIAVRRVIQFFFYEQWRALRAHCAEKSVRIVGDTAIFVDYDSADVWAHRQLWRLKEDLEPEAVSGVPPDAFSKSGQRWGNPLYDWDAMRANGYAWWIQRLRWATATCDFIRLDHFRGFAQFWEIPAHDETAINGRWVDGPRDELFDKLKKELGSLPFFAEDLGYITPDVHQLREAHQIPGMAVLQFAFGDPGAHVYLPHRLTADRVVYTGTHDNDTTLGWWNSSATEKEKHAALAYVGAAEDGINWSLIRAAQASPAGFSVVPAQDVLGLGSEARMNTPSVKDGNFRWRIPPDSLKPALAARLASLAEVTDRLPQTLTVPPSEEFVA